MAALFTMVFALGGWRTGLSRLADNSFMWHLRTGERILDHGVPHADPYSFTAAGIRWIAQSWLAEAIYGIVDRAAGGFGLRLLVATTGALIAGLAYRLVLRICADHVVATVLTLAAVGASFTLWSERPLFLGLLAFVGLLWIVEVPDSAVGRRPLVAVPALMWFWANVHGTFALGFAYLALHVAGRWLEGAPPWQGRERRLVGSTALAAAATLANPYGLRLLLFPVGLLGRGDILRQVTEWRSPDVHTVQGLMLAVWAVVLAACLVIGRRRLSRRDLLVVIPFLLLAVWAERNIALAPLVGVPAAARAVRAATPRPRTGSAVNRVVAVALLALGGIWTLQAAGDPDFDLHTYPVGAMRYVAGHGLLGHRLMTTDSWAGYVILEYWPRQRVFGDDRYDMYPVPLLRDFFRFADADRSWPEILDRWAIDVVVWRRSDAITRRMQQSAGWKQVYQDDLAVVLVRAPDAPPPPEPPPPPPPATGPRAAPDLQDVVDGFVARQAVAFSVVAEDRAGGRRASVQATRPVLSASLYKLFVAAELLRRFDAGVLGRDAPTGDGRTAGECVRAMIVVSDNRCGVWGLGQVGYGRFDARLTELGFPGTSLASPQRTTAADVARFFERARDGSLLGPGRERATGELYALLQEQQVADRFPRGLPPGTPVAHKTGDRLHWAHDAGIITTPAGEVLLVVLSGPWPAPCCDADHPGPGEAAAFGAIAELAALVYAAL
jgi:beta-lactamase class A